MRAAKLGLALLLLATGALLLIEWRRSALPGPERVRAAVEAEFGAPFDDLRAAALHWSMTDPERTLDVGGWELRLALEGEPPAHKRTRVVLGFLAFAHNRHFDSGWPNGVFYEWEVRARPRTPMACLRCLLFVAD